MSGKAGGKIEVYDYQMSIHMGICAAGDGLQLLALKYGDKEMWRGSVTDDTTIGINLPDLFGGAKKEGGVGGSAWWLPGKASQIMPPSLAARLGLTSTTCPGFRGLASVFFTGAARGFMWGSNNPYLRPLVARVRRPSIGLNPAIALIRMPNDSVGRAQYASNPAHMIYECLIDTDWGMGEAPGVIDKDAFEACATTLYNEGFGLNMIWTRQSEIGKFIGEILTHIQGALYVDPSTGKHTLKLLRADYDVDTLPVIDPSNAVLTSFKRKVWGEISNEVVVTMTNSESGKEETVAAQDLAGIAAEGGVISSSQNYYGVTSQDLAIKLADRDLATSVNPIATCEAQVTRKFWDTVSGGVVKLSWPEYDIEQIVFRVSQVSKDDNTVTLSLYEDIFGLDSASYLTPGETEWGNPSQPPSPVSYYQVGTAPAFMLASALGLSDPSELDFPEAMSTVTVGADANDDVSFDLVSYVKDVNGTTTRTSLGNRSYRSTWAILSGLPAEAQSLLPTLSGLRGRAPEAGDFVLIGTGQDQFTEIASVQSVSESGYLLNRGLLDTVPRAWPAATRAFVIPASSIAVDPTVRSVNENASYWMLARTTAGVLALEDAPQINVTLSARPYLPNRPANVKVNGVGSGKVDATTATELTVTWANRNRTLESTQVMKWTDADVAGEAGQTTMITVRTPSGSLIATYSALNGTSKVIPLATVTGQRRVVISASAQNGDYESLQAMALTVVLISQFYSAAAMVATADMSAAGIKKKVIFYASVNMDGAADMSANRTVEFIRAVVFDSETSMSVEIGAAFDNGFDSGFYTSIN